MGKLRNKLTKERLILLLTMVIFTLIFMLDTVQQAEASHGSSYSGHILTDNSSFEQGGTSPTSWGIWIPSSSSGSIERVEGVSRTGEASLLIDHLDRGGPHQNLTHEGRLDARLYLMTPAGTNTNATVELKFHLKDSNENTIPGESIESGVIPVPATAGTWVPITLSGTIPAEANGVAVHQVMVIATFDNAHDTEIYVDDFEVAKELNLNSSFEQGGTSPTDWGIWIPSSSSGSIDRLVSASDSRTGDAILRINHLDRGGLHQTINAHEGPVDALGGPMEAELYYSNDTNTIATVQFTFRAKDINGTTTDFKSDEFAIQNTSGAWTSLKHRAMIPEEINGVAVEEVLVLATFDDGGNAQIYVDDFTVTKVLDDSLVVVEAGQANAVVIHEDNAPSEVVGAADDLALYVKKSTDAIIPVMTSTEFAGVEGSYEDHIKIYIGHVAPGDQADINAGLNNLDEEGFMIHPHGSNITIIGPTVRGTTNGVYDWLERNVGVRWLMLGEVGEDVPVLTDIKVSRLDVIEEPAFTMRFISAAMGSHLWWKANKTQSSLELPIEFTHNLYNLFDPDKFGTTNPEFYPDGNPPDSGDHKSWQPCFTAEGIVDAAVQEIVDYFNANPNAESYSLGINDTKAFCEADPNHSDYPDQNMSDIYYAWVNDVVEGVLAVHPDKWFGLLAYYNVTEAPSFTVHPRVVPFIAKDRMAWVDQDMKTDGYNQQNAWNVAANQFGWYDYMYGTHYLIPRIYPHLMAENLQYAAQNQAYGHYVETYHNIGDGPKAWIAANLMWDPNQDVDRLMKEWYVRTVGPDAADDLAALYQIWEDYWTNRIKDTSWFSREKDNTYLGFGSQDYAKLVTDQDIQNSMTLVNNVVANAGTALQQSRAEKIRSMFEYYEASVLSFPREMDPIPNEATALDILNNLDNQVREQLMQDRINMKQQFEGDPNLEFRSSRWYEWSVSNPYEFRELVRYIQTNEPNGGNVTNQVENYALDDTSSIQDYAKLLKEAVAGHNTLTKNSSFELGSSEATDWSEWIKGAGTIQRVETMSYTGNASLLIDGMERGGAVQSFNIRPGMTSAQVHYKTPAGTNEGTIQLTLHLRDQNKSRLKSYRTEIIDLSLHADTWQPLSLLEEIPETVNGVPVAEGQLIIVISGAENSQVYLDDAVVYQSALSTFNEDPSFEMGSLNSTDWTAWITGAGTIQYTDTMSYSGSGSLLIDGMERGGPAQKFDIQPGMVGAEVLYYTPATTNEGTIKISLHVRDSGDNHLHTYSTAIVDLSVQAGSWNVLGLFEDIPQSIDGVPVARAQMVVVIDGAEDSQVYLDDARVYD